MPAAVGWCVGTSILWHLVLMSVDDERKWVEMGGDGPVMEKCSNELLMLITGWNGWRLDDLDGMNGRRAVVTG
jgi:hypothetical protein